MIFLSLKIFYAKGNTNNLKYILRIYFELFDFNVL